MVRVVFVCTGNICRSPTAEAVLRHMVAEQGLADRVEIESAGTHGYHVGEPPDRRTGAAAARRGYDLSHQRARQVSDGDFESFDLILAMDRGHLATLSAAAGVHKHKVALFLDHAAEAHRAVADGGVPDPYYGGPNGFETVLDLVEAGCAGVLRDIRRRLGTG